MKPKGMIDRRGQSMLHKAFIGDCRVKQDCSTMQQLKGLMVDRFPQRQQRIAVWDALMCLADRQLGKNTFIVEECITGLHFNRQGAHVQVDLGGRNDRKSFCWNKHK